MPPNLEKLLRDMIGSIVDTNAQLEAKRISVDRWQYLLATDVLVGHYAAYMTGKNSKQLTPSEQRDVKTFVAEQVDYLNRFADQIEASGWLPAYGARALLYGGSLKASFWKGRTVGWDLPYYPAEGTTCLSNCKCSWEPGSLDEEDLTGEWYWRRSADDSCDVCMQRERETPIRFFEGERV
jgi:hypothetical protein